MTSSPSGRRSTSTTAAGCSGRRSTRWPEASSVGIATDSVGVVEVNGLRVRYLDQGRGHPLLLCHGFAGSLENFHSWAPALAPHRRMIIPDLPGFGETPAGRSAHTVAGQGEFLQAFAERIGLGPHDAGGICLGATVALEHARRNPQVVTRLVLHTPIYSPAVLRARVVWQARIFTLAPLYRGAEWLRSVRGISDLYKRFVVEGPGVDPYDAQLNFLNQCRADPQAARGWLRDGIRQDYRDFLRGWSKPVLVVVAANDLIVDVDAIRRFPDLVPQAAVQVIESAGHGWTAQLIAAQVAAIVGFLK